MGIISLEGIEFFAYHGFLDEEQKIGNKYSVDISVKVDFSAAAESDKLRETVNYEDLYHIIREEINKPSRLLEHIGKRIIRHAFNQFAEITDIEVSISKFNPPIGGVCHRARVTLSEKRQK